MQAERAAHAQGARRICGEAERTRHRYDPAALHSLIQSMCGEEDEEMHVVVLSNQLIDS